MQGVSGTTLRHPQPHSGKVFVARRLGAVLRDNNVKPQNNGMRRFLDLRLPAECVLNLTGLIKKHNISEINIHERTSEECLLRILEQDKSPDLLVIGSQIRISQSSLSEILQEEGIRVSGLKGILSSVWVTLSVRKALEEILAEEGIKEVTVQTIAKSDFSDAAKIKNILTSKIIGEELILFAGETTTGVDLPTSKLEAKDLLLAIIGFNQSIKNRGETFDRYQGKFAQFVKKDPQRIAQAFFGQVDNPLLKKRSDQALKMLQKNLVGLADHEINCALLDEFQKIGSDDSQELLIELSRYLANIFPANESYPSYEEGILEEQAEKGIIGKIEYLEQVCLLKSTFLEAYRQTHGIKGKIKKKRKGSIPKAERIILKLEGNLHKKESELRAARLKERATMEEIWQSAIKRKNEEVLLTLMDSYVGFYFIVEKIKSNKISPFSLMRIFKLAEKKEEEGLRLLALERLFEILKEKPLGGEATLAKFNPNGSSSASSTMIIPDPSEEGQVRIFLNKLAEEDLYMPLWTRELFLLMDKDSGKHKNKHLLGYFFHHNVQAHITKANALFEKGQFEEAIDFYKAALKTYPQNPEARYNISVCWSRIGNHEIKNNCMAAEAAFTMALEYNPKNIDALNRLSMIYAVNDDFKSVEKISRRLLELLDTEDFNRDSSLRLIKNASIDEMRTISQGNLGMALVYQYSSQKGIGSLEEAIGHLESAKKAQSDSPNHDLNLSLAYLGVENLENAIECTNSYFDNPKTANSVLAIRLINDYLHYAINNHLTAEKKPELGSVFSRMIEVITGFSDDTIANKDGAVVDLTTATIYLARIGIKNLADQLGEHLLEICRSKQHQDLYFACYERAIVLYDSKRHEEALILLEEILSNDKNTNYNIYSEFTGDSSPLKANAMNLMSQIRKKIAERDKDETQMEQAIELVEQAIEEYPETAILHYSRGNLLETRNKTESSDLTRAANSYKIAIEKCPEFMIAHLALIDAYRQLNKQGKMQKAIERAKAELTIVLDEPDQAEYLIATDFIEELIKLYIKSKDMTLYKMIQLCRKKGPQDGLRSALDNIPDLPIELLNIQADLN